MNSLPTDSLLFLTNTCSCESLHHHISDDLRRLVEMQDSWKQVLIDLLRPECSSIYSETNGTFTTATLLRNAKIIPTAKHGLLKEMKKNSTVTANDFRKISCVVMRKGQNEGNWAPNTTLLNISTWRFQKVSGAMFHQQMRELFSFLGLKFFITVVQVKISSHRKH